MSDHKYHLFRSKINHPEILEHLEKNSWVKRMGGLYKWLKLNKGVLLMGADTTYQYFLLKSFLITNKAPTINEME